MSFCLKVDKYFGYFAYKIYFRYLSKIAPSDHNPSHFFCLFSSFQHKFKLTKAWLVCLGFELRAAGWKAQTIPLSYGDTPLFYVTLNEIGLIVMWADSNIFFLFFCSAVRYHNQLLLHLHWGHSLTEQDTLSFGPKI